MKKLTFTLILAFVFAFSLSINTFAEGEIPNVGKTCGVANTPPCPVAEPIEPTEDTTFNKILEYLSEIFG